MMKSFNTQGSRVQQSVLTALATVMSMAALNGCSDEAPLPTVSVASPDDRQELSEDILEYSGIEPGRTLFEINGRLIPLAERVFCTEVTEQGHSRLYYCGEQKILVTIDNDLIVTSISDYVPPVPAPAATVRDPFDVSPTTVKQSATAPRRLNEFLSPSPPEPAAADDTREHSAIMDSPGPLWVEIPLGAKR